MIKRIIIGLLFGVILGVIVDYITTPNITPKYSLQNTIYIVKPRQKLSRLTETNVYNELKKQGIKHPKIVLAQSKLETGLYTSKVCKQYNNLFGLMKGKSYHKFNHWTESVTYYKNHIQSRYKGGDYYAFLSKSGYAEDNKYCHKLKKLIR